VTGSHRISPFFGLTVVSIAWVTSLVAFVALWTIAPSVIFLQSMQQQPAAAVSPSADNTFVTLSAQAAMQHSRRMRGHSLHTVLQGRAEPAAAVPDTIPDCQKQQQAQLPSSKQQPDVHAAAEESKPQQPQQQQPQQQQQPGVPAAQPVVLDPQHGLPADLVKQLGPVDVVYMWVNGSDPVLTKELQDFEARQRKQGASGASGPSSIVGPVAKDDPVRGSRFDSDRDELRYSLRSLEMYMPWVNKIWIITNGQASVGCLWQG
jgi:hypothetical protein